jgi:hypothetical protein
MRETIEQKALRLISERRLHVHRIAERRVEAHCNGDTRSYTLTYDGRGWRCDCPARKRCAHLTALQLVADPPKPLSVADARAHDRYHATRTGGTAEADEWETVAGAYVLDACPRCGNHGRVSRHDGLCPTCTQSPR